MRSGDLIGANQVTRITIGTKIDPKVREREKVNGRMKLEIGNRVDGASGDCQRGTRWEKRDSEISKLSRDIPYLQN